jgi:CBS domain-containing membrane protein
VAKEHRVQDVMSTELITLQQDESLDLVEQVMRLGRIRHVPVTRGGELVGLVTHRDLLRASVSALADIGDDERWELLSAVRVRDIMNTEVQTVSASMPLAEAGKLLLDNRYGCLPVVGPRGRLVGIITEADFLKFALVLLKQLDESQSAS